MKSSTHLLPEGETIIAQDKSGAADAALGQGRTHLLPEGETIIAQDKSGAADAGSESNKSFRPVGTV